MPTPFDQFIAPASQKPALWRLGLGLLFTFAIYVGLTLAVFLLVQRVVPNMSGFSLDGTTASSALGLLLTFVPLLLGLAVAVRLFHSRSPASLLGPRWEVDFLRAACLLLLLNGGLLLYGHVTGSSASQNLPLRTWVLLLPFAAAATLLQTLAEEVLFRGYLLQQLAARFAARWIGIVVPSLLFGAAHTQPDIFGAAWPVPVIAATVFGFIAADLTVRRGNLGMAWGMHFATNFFALIIVTAGPTMTGLALWRSDIDITDLGHAPWLVLVDLTPLIIAWIILRSGTKA